MEKTRLLFVIESLVAAGAEKSLVTLLSVLDYSRYEVDLQLFSYGGEFEKYLPPQVRLLPPLPYYEFAKQGALRQLLTFDWRKIVARWRYSLAIRRGHTFHPDKARLFWKIVSPCLSPASRAYDAAIAYAQGVPTFYVVDKVRAAKKLGWVNVGYRLQATNQQYQRHFYEQLSTIVTVSDAALQTFAGVYPEFAPKMTVIWDMLDANFIQRLASEAGDKELDSSVPRLLTIARLNKPQKGYDISLEACRILKERGLRFKWYAVGRGSYREEMERYIEEHQLQDTFVLLGTTPNPYPYIRQCTLYVQTSRHEGYGLSIAEARILNRPVVTTEFDAVYNQMVPGKNGLVVPQEPAAVADAVERLLGDAELYDAIVAYQRQEKKGNTEEVEKFYRLLEG